VSRSVRASCAAVLAVALVACTPGAGPGTSDPSPRSSTGSPSPSEPTSPPPVVPPPPPDGACYRLSFGELPEPANDSDPVPCRNRHDAQTIHVGRLDTVVDGHAVAVDSDVVQRQLARTCPQRLARFLGGTAEDRRLSRFHVVWFSPTLEQAAAGAEWFRCDVIAFAADKTLFPLPSPGRLRGVLDTDRTLATYGLCGTAAPGERSFEPVICARRHSWRAIATIPLGGGDEYPGTSTVRAAGDDTCKDRVRDEIGPSLRFRYGWEWPTREQWQQGQHHGFCWAPTG
jgi:hypothetical protein